MRDGRGAHRPQPAQVDGRAADERVVAEPAEELGVVVVEREHPAELLRGGDGVGTDRDRAVGRLPRVRDRVGIPSCEKSVAKASRRVTREPRRQRQGVRPMRLCGDLDHGFEPTRLRGHGPKSQLRRRVVLRTFATVEKARRGDLVLAVVAVAIVVVALAPRGWRRLARDRRRPAAHAGRPQPRRDAGEHPLDDLQARLDVDDPPADLRTPTT